VKSPKQGLTLSECRIKIIINNPIVSQEGAASCKVLVKETLKDHRSEKAVVFVLYMNERKKRLKEEKKRKFQEWQKKMLDLYKKIKY
jgi:hypothetical protein